MQGAQVQESGTRLQFLAEQVSNFTSSANGGGFAFFDGETTVLTYVLSRPLAQNLEWGFEVPYVLHTGGALDGLIDEFHDAFGLNDGGRPSADRNRLDYFFRYRGETYADIQKSRRELGDVRVMLGYRVFDSAARALAVRALVKAPTGEASELSGSGGWDGALWFEYRESELLRRLGIDLTLGGGLVGLGEGDFADEARNNSALVGHFGMQRAFGRRFRLLAQLDAHTELLDTGLREVNDGTIIGTLGGRLQVADGLRVDLALLEDLRGRSTPDVVFQLRLAAEL
jgi:hypothetical protein